MGKSLFDRLILEHGAERAADLLIEKLGNGPEVLDLVKYSWDINARPEQLPPTIPFDIWVILAGRGFGKTRSGAEYIRHLVDTNQAKHIALVGPTAALVRDVMVEGESGLLNIFPPHQRPVYEPSKRRLTFYTGAVATCFSAEEPESLRGPQFDAAWGDELCAWANPEALDQLRFGLRLGTHPTLVLTTTPKPTKQLKALLAEPGVVVTRGSMMDNKANLAPSFINSILSKYEGTRLGRQEINAEILWDVQGALWNMAMLDPYRVATAPPMTQVVVAVDPAVSTGKNSDLTGIVVAGKGVDGRFYVLQDLTGKYSPEQWASRAVAAYHTHKANRIVFERNQGGDMCESVLRHQSTQIPLRGVHASRGKLLRAEPCAMLYEQGRVSHVGAAATWAPLEDQLLNYSPESPGSPDRLDALVWALTDLSENAPARWVLPAGFIPEPRCT